MRVPIVIPQPHGQGRLPPIPLLVYGLVVLNRHHTCTTVEFLLILPVSERLLLPVLALFVQPVFVLFRALLKFIYYLRVLLTVQPPPLRVRLVVVLSFAGGGVAGVEQLRTLQIPGGGPASFCYILECVCAVYGRLGSLVVFAVFGKMAERGLFGGVLKRA